MPSRVAHFLSELKRRRVVHVAGAYLVVGAVLGGVANDFLPSLGAPGWAVSFVIVLILIGFPVALVLAWAY
jgi:adenylate cyclase